jgi:hypothetical protein
MGIQHAMIVPAACFIICLGFALRVGTLRRNDAA